MRLFIARWTGLAMKQMQRDWSEYRGVTLNDVAREAGVSQSAASVILNGARSGTRVSSQKRRLVLEVAQRIGYRPNALARSLTTGRTNRIGLYSTSQLDSKNLFFAELLSGVMAGAAEERLNTMIHTSGWDEASLLDLVSNRALDGLVIHGSQNDPIIPLLSDLRVPAVAVVDRIIELPSVIVDDAAGGELQARHLASLGHRHVLLKGSPHPCWSADARIQSFIDCAEGVGIRCSYQKRDQQGEEALTASDMKILTEGADRATALIAWNDSTAYRACEQLISLGLSIPDQVAVMGFDGFTQLSPPRMTLSVIRAPWSAVGKAAVNLLHQLIAGQPVSGVTVIPVEFIRGDTT